MALKKNENRLKFGLKRVAFALATIAEDGSATYGDVVSFPGARNLSMEPQGSGEPWNADDGVYYSNTAPTSRQGDLEMARFIDAFKRMVLGYIADANGVLVEDMSPEEVHFALLFETMNDTRPRRYVLYNCTATAPAVGSATNEGNKEPQTETSTITSMGIYVESHGKWFDHGETTPSTDPEAYANWFSTVQLPGPPPDPYPVKTVTGSPVIITDAAEDMAVDAMLVGINLVQSGSGDSAPDNERPIAGWTGATVERIGKNLANIADNSYTNSGVNFVVSGGAVSLTGTSTGTINRTIGTVQLLAGVTYAISGTESSGIADANTLRIDLRASGGGVIASGDSYNGFTYTPDEDITAQINIRLAGGETIDATIYPQVEAGENATDFEPYAMTSWAISWSNEAGTVCGGILDVLTGELTADWVLLETTWGDGTNVKIGDDVTNKDFTLPCLYSGLTQDQSAAICNLCSWSDSLYRFTTPAFRLAIKQSGVSVTPIATVALPNNTADDQVVQIAYIVKTPVTYQLTPTEVRTLLGNNVFSADCGEVTVSYHSDPAFHEE